MGTIQKHLKTWREQGMESKALQTPPPKPAEEAVQKMLGHIWSLALYQAEQDAETRVRQVKAEQQAVQEDADIAWKEVERLEKSEKDLQDQLAVAGQQAAGLQASLTEAADRHARLEAARTEALTEKEDLARRLDAREQENAREVARARELAEQLRQAEQNCENALRRHIVLEHNLEESGRRLKDLEAREAQARALLDKMNVQFAALEERARAAAQARDDLAAENTGLRMDLARGEGRMMELQSLAAERKGLLEQIARLMEGASRPAAPEKVITGA